jgi:hypothetical protein
MVAVLLYGMTKAEESFWLTSHVMAQVLEEMYPGIKLTWTSNS